MFLSVRAIGFALAVLGLGTIAHGQSIRKLIDFEAQEVGSPIFNQYPGVVFPGGDAADHQIEIVQPPLGTISGTKALRKQSPGCEGRCGNFSMQFMEGQHRVKMSTGLIQSSSSGNLAAVLRGYDASGTQVAQSGVLVLGSMPTAIDNAIEVTSPSGSIRSVTLSLVLADNLFTLGGDFPVVIDNLEYDAPIALPPPDTIPPVITITDPSSGQTVQGGVPGMVSVTVRATIVETALKSATISVNGGPAVGLGYLATAPGEYSASAFITASDGLQEGPNTITITATDFNNNTGAESTQFTFVIQPLPPPATVDIVLAGIQVSQGIDTGPFLGDAQSISLRRFSYPGPYDLRLVQGKRTLVRIYAVAARTNSPVSNVPATMHVSKAGCTSNCLLTDKGPLVPMSNAATPNLSGVTVPVAGSSTTVLLSRVGDLGSTWNFFIPADWTKQDLDLSVTLNSGLYYPLPNVRSVPECKAVFEGECDRNNDLKIHLSFTPAKTVTLDPVFVRFQGTLAGGPVDSTTTMADATAAWKTVNLFYPMNVKLGSARSLTVRPDLDEGDLLTVFQEHFGCAHWWNSCVINTGQFIVGLIPGDATKFPALKEASGLSNRGNNAFWAQGSVPTATAHEMGHAIGFKHASCDHGEGSSFTGIFGGTNCDNDYPIAHGGIGGYGFNFDAWDPTPPNPFIPPDTPAGPVILPGIPDAKHFHVHDFMSYGQLEFRNSLWVSTYMWDITTDDSFADTVHYRDCTKWGIPIPFSSCGVDHAQSPTASSALVTSTVLSPPKTRSVAPAEGLLTRPAILVSGHINADGTATLLPSYPGLLSGELPDPGDSPFSITVLDSKGNTLTLRNVIPQLRQIHSGDTSGDFSEIIAISAGQSPAVIQLLYQGEVIASLTSQPDSHPTVVITSPLPGERWSPTQTRRISWITSGTAAQIHAQVEYSADGGATSIPLGRNIDSGFLDVNVDELSGSENGQITVRVSDGVSGAFATSGPFVVEPKPPQVTIVQPANGSVLISGAPITLTGMAVDIQETLPDNALVWTSDMGGTLGTGSQLTTQLAPGRHVITLSAKNSLGLSATASVQVQVADLGDVNADGVVNCTDVAIVKASFGKHAGEPGFDARADVNKDGVVDILDLAFVAQHADAGAACP